MAEYIKRMDTFSDEMCEGIDCGVCPFYNKAGENDCQVVAFLRSIPAADVRPVVLCRDCRRWDTDWTPNYAIGNEHFCPVVGLTTRSDWFCADGEKREKS